MLFNSYKYCLRSEIIGILQFIAFVIDLSGISNIISGICFDILSCQHITAWHVLGRGSQAALRPVIHGVSYDNHRTTTH